MQRHFPLCMDKQVCPSTDPSTSVRRNSRRRLRMNGFIPSVHCERSSDPSTISGCITMHGEPVEPSQRSPYNHHYIYSFFSLCQLNALGISKFVSWHTRQPPESPFSKRDLRKSPLIKGVRGLFLTAFAVHLKSRCQKSLI